MRHPLPCAALVVPALLAPLAAQGANAPVVINEFSYDDSGFPDYREFVELYNATGAAIDISNWTIAAEGPGGAFPSFTINAGTMLAAGGYYVVGSSAVPNVNQVVLNPTTGLDQDLLDNSNASLTLRDTAGNSIDTLVYEANKGLWNPALAEAEGVWGNFRSIDSSTSGFPIESSWSRIRDGRDTGNNGRDFYIVPMTPGTSNAGAFSATLPFTDNFDLQSPDTPAVGFSGSFEFPFVVDPTLPGNYLLGWLPTSASPQGGNCLALWDPAGGGDMGMLLAEVDGGAVFEAWVYFDSGIEASVAAGTTQCLSSGTEYQTWSIGFGSTGTFFNSPDPTGYIASTFGGPIEANGNTGVSWVYQITDQGGTLSLVDHNDGAWNVGLTNANVIGSINIQPGVNDGWQRLRLERSADSVLGTFGGMVGSGCATGNNLAAAIDPADMDPVTLYIGYREFVCDNNNDAHPLLIDDLRVTAATSAISYFGSAFAHSVGTPAIGTNGPPTIGNNSWQITGTGLVPNSITALVVAPLTATVALGPLGGQPGSALAIPPTLVFPAPTSATGDVAIPVNVPCNPSLVGRSIYWQLADLDPSLPFVLPLGVSRGMDTQFGN